MKRLGYYPALVVLLSVYLVAIGFFVLQSAGTLDSMKKYKSSGEMLKSSQTQLTEEELKLENNQKVDKVYNDYFARWIDKEGRIDETKLKQRLQKMAEELSLNIYEMVPLDTPESATDGHESKELKAKSMPNKSMPFNSMAMPSRGTLGGIPLSATPMIELKVTLMGPFSQLMVWVERAENELGSLRIVQTRWVARSPDEVRLTIGFRYKMIGGTK